MHFVSARHGTGVGDLVASMIRAYEAAMRQMPTPALTKAMEKAMVQHQPPIVRGRRIRLRYAHQGGRNPPRIIVHGSQAAHVPESYKRYLANMFRDDVRPVRDAGVGGIPQRRRIRIWATSLRKSADSRPRRRSGASAASRRIAPSAQERRRAAAPSRPARRAAVTRSAGR